MAYRYDKTTAERPRAEMAHHHHVPRTRAAIAHDEALLALYGRRLDELYGGDMDFVGSDLEHRSGRDRP